MNRFSILGLALMSAIALAQDSNIKAPLGTGSVFAKPDSPIEKAATLKSLKDFYGLDRDINFMLAKSAAGDTASGVVVERSRDQITVDTTPCVVDRKRLVTFVAPYKESKLGEQRCEAKTFPRVQVIQMGAGWK